MKPEFYKGQIVKVIPSSVENGVATVVSVGRENLFLHPHSRAGMDSHWTIAYENKRGTDLNDDIYSVPKFHCRPTQLTHPEKE